MTTYYVNAATGNDSFLGVSADTAFATPQHAVDQTGPGDTVLVASGTYSADQATGFVVATGRSGAAGALITLEAAPGARPIFSLPNGGVAAVQINGSYWLVQGFEMIGNSASITLADGQARAAASTPGQPQDRTIIATGVIVSYNGSGVTRHHVTINDNVIHHFPGGGIGTESCDYITITGNNINNCCNYSPYGASGISVYGSHDIDNNTGTYKNVITGNFVWNNAQLVGSYAIGAGSAITDGEGLLIDDNSNDQSDHIQYLGRTLVACNIGAGNGSAAFAVYASSNVDLFGNTCYQNDPQGLHGGNLVLTRAVACRMANNLVQALPGTNTIVTDGTSSATYEDYNLEFGGNLTGTGPHNVRADPKLTYPGLGFYLPGAGSAAIGAANAAYIQAFDYLGHAKPASGLYDMGAVQHQVPTPVTVGAGSSSIVVLFAEDAYKGDAQFTVAVDGVPVGGTLTTNALDAAGQTQAFTLKGNWSGGAHTLHVAFLNPDSGGGPTFGRILRAISLTAAGTTTTLNAAIPNGTRDYAFTLPLAATPGRKRSYQLASQGGDYLAVGGRKWGTVP